MHAIPELIGDHQRLIAICVRQYQDEFISSPATAYIQGAFCHGLDAGCHFFENFVPLVMSVQVVDRLELVDINVKEAERFLLPDRVIHQPGKLNFRSPPVCETGYWIGDRLKEG